MFEFKKYNIADWFSFYRILAAPFLLILIIIDEKELFVWFLLMSYSTDIIDGFLARTLKITSPRGAQLDSYGDQFTFSVALIGIIIYEFEFIKENYKLIVFALLLYLIQLVIAYSKYSKPTAFHTYLAKLSAIFQGTFILLLFFFEPVYWLFYLTLILGILDSIEEIILIYMYKKWVPEVKGIFWAINDERRVDV